jgi:hypothetical protein
LRTRPSCPIADQGCSAAERALGGDAQEFGGVVGRQAAIGDQLVESLDARQRSEQVDGTADGDVVAQDAGVIEAAGEVLHAAAPAFVHPLDRAADGVRVEARHRREHSVALEVGREHPARGEDRAAQVFPRVGGRDGSGALGEARSLDQVVGERAEADEHGDGVGVEAA